jgi:Flp pilus assembly protein TadD
MRGGLMMTFTLATLATLGGCASPPANQLGSGCPYSGPEQPKLSEFHALNCEGKYYLAKGKYAHAIQNFTMAIQLYPTDPKDFYNRSQAYRALGMTTEADADTAKARQLEAAPPPA